MASVAMEMASNLPSAFDSSLSGVSIVSAQPGGESHLSEDYLARRFGKATRKDRIIAYEITRDAALLHQYSLLNGRMSMAAGADASRKDATSDDQNLVIVARLGRQLIAGCRVAFLAKKDIRHLDPVTGILPQETCMELSDIAMLEDFHDSKIVFGLLRLAFEQARMRKVNYFVNLASQQQARFVRRATSVLGFKKWKLLIDLGTADHEDYEGAHMTLSVLCMESQIKKETAPVRRMELANA